MRWTAAVALTVLAGCSDGRGTPPAPSEPVGPVTAELRLNAEKSGTFDCSGGLFFAATVRNATAAPVRVDNFTLAFERVAGAWCASHAAPFDPALGVSVPAGGAAEVRRVDLAGDLCAAPHGDPGCAWTATATLATSAGPLTDTITFATASPSGTAPAPAPTNAPGNRAPTLSLAGGGSCHPSPGRPCAVEFVAEARDADGDPLTFAWSGCAAGTGTRATCVVRTPEVHTVRVDVSDGHGGFARRFGEAMGTNAPPVIRFGTPRPPDPAPANTFYPIAGGQPEDPDGDEDFNEICRSGRTSLVVSGACRADIAACGGVGDAFDVDVRTLSGPGTCMIEAQARDSWGAVGRDVLTFRVLP